MEIEKRGSTFSGSQQNSAPGEGHTGIPGVVHAGIPGPAGVAAPIGVETSVGADVLSELETAEMEAADIRAADARRLGILTQLVPEPPEDLWHPKDESFRYRYRSGRPRDVPYSGARRVRDSSVD